MIIVIDGPAGSGKSSVSQLIASQLGINYLDTGSMYRMITYYFLINQLSFDEQTIKDNLDYINITYVDNQLLLNGEDVSANLRSNEINDKIKIISNDKNVRSKMIVDQRNIASQSDFICDGRDLGTIVFPNADYKFYLTASVDVRAKRRYLENQQLGIKGDIEQIKRSISERDYNDMHREIAPLKQAADAIVIHTDNLTLNEVCDLIISFVK